MVKKEKITFTVSIPRDLYAELQERRLIGNVSMLCIHLLRAFLNSTDFRIEEGVNRFEAKKLIEDYFEKWSFGASKASSAPPAPEQSPKLEEKSENPYEDWW